MKFLINLLFLSVFFSQVYSQSTEFSVFNRVNSTSISDQNTREKVLQINSAQTLGINNASLLNIFQVKPNTASLVLPTKDGDLILEMEETKILSDDFKINTPQGEYKTQLPIFYRGKIKGEPQSTVVLTITPKTIDGMIWSKKINLTLGKIKDSPQNLHIVYNTDEIKNETPICAGEVFKEASALELNTAPHTTSTSNCRAVEIFMEVDNYTHNLWGMTTVVNSMTNIFNNVSQLYRNDEINLLLKELFVWTTVDPYDPAPDTGAMLDSLDNYWNTQGNTFNGDIVHLVSAKNYQGGVAYLYTGGFPSVFNGMTTRAVFAVCGKSAAKGVSTSISSTLLNIPTFSWNVEVVAHEIGHNFGLPHTHNCSWSDGVNPPNAIDNCGPTANPIYTENGCTSGPTPSQGGGTIMSYCHLTSTGISFVNGFGPLVKAKMAAEVNAASCLGGVIVSKPGVNSPVICSGSTATLTASGCSGGTYSWYATSTSTTVLATTSSFTTPILTAPTSYFVTCTQNSCESFRREAVVTFFSNQAPDTQDIEICTSSAILTASGCDGFTLNWYNLPSGGSILYSGNSFAVNNISSDTTYYVECQSNSCGTSPRSALNIDFLEICPYCEPTGLNCGDNDEVTRFRIMKGSSVVLDNYSDCVLGGFSLFDVSNSVTLYRDSTYSFRIENPGIWQDGLRVWFDFDNSISFDAGELLFSHYNSSPWTSQTFNVTIPSTASLGTTRIRLKVLFQGQAGEPCAVTGGQGFGEIEDYIITIADACTPTLTFGAINQAAGEYKAVNTIESQANVANGTTYQAGKAITLQPGFQAGSDEVFRAQIGGCP